MSLAKKLPEMIVKLPNAKVVTFEYEQTIPSKSQNPTILGQGGPSITQPVWTLFLFKSTWTRSQGSQFFFFY